MEKDHAQTIEKHLPKKVLSFAKHSNEFVTLASVQKCEGDN
jgi:hypothetical protein